MDLRELASYLSRVRLVVSDVDGTLLDGSHRVASVTRTAVDACLSAGIRVVLASSRGPVAMRSVMADLPSLAGGTFIASQGAVTGHFAADGGRLVVREHSPLDLDDAQSVVRQALTMPISVSWYTPSEWLTSDEDSWISSEAIITRATPTVVNLEKVTDPPSKLMLVTSPERTQELVALARSLPRGVQGQFSNANYLEVTRTGVDKGAALRKYLSHHSIDPCEVVALGNGLNDLSLFEVAACSVAPSNSHRKALAAADAVVPSNEANGPAELLTWIAAAVRAP